MNKSIRNISASVSSLIGFTIAFSIFLLTVRIAEVIAFSDQTQWGFELFLEKSLYLDLLTSVSFGFYLLPLCLVFFKRNNTLLFFLYGVISISQIYLSAFHFSSHKLLGNALYHYSLTELAHIISSGITTELIVYVFSLIILMISVAWVWYETTNKTNLSYRAKLIYSLIFILITSIIWSNNKKHLIDHCHLRKFNSLQEFHLGNSKIPFFVQATIHHFANYAKDAYTENLYEIIDLHIAKSENHSNSQFPFLVDPVTSSTLSPYFKSSNIPPNIVIIIVESLSSSFSGPTNYLGSHTPFIDSLSRKGLHWPNMLSNAEKSYGAVPNIVGSLPYGTYHHSIASLDNLYSLKYDNLFSLLPANYYTSFSCGGNSNFDNAGPILLLNRIDCIQDESTLNILTKQSPDLTWGHNDYTLFDCAINKLHKEDQSFATVLFTLGMHHPFDQRPLDIVKDTIPDAIQNKDILQSIHSSDESLKNYFDSVKTKPYFNNTIFVITGDHVIDGLERKTPLDVFHVPLIIYSPLQNQSKRFWNIVTHRDILPSLVGLLNENYNLNINRSFSTTGFQLDTNSTFKPKNVNSLSFRDPVLPQFIHHEHYLLQNEVWRIEDSLLTSRRIENDSILSILKSDVFRRRVVNDFTIHNHRLVPD